MAIGFISSIFCRFSASLAVVGIAMLAAGAAPTTAPATQSAPDAGPAASLITLHMKNAPAEKVYEAVFHQAGVRLRVEPGHLFADSAQPIPPLSIDADNQPFWLVVQQLYATSRLSLFAESPTDIRLARAMPIFPGPQSLSGPFLFVAFQFEVVMNLKAHEDAPSGKQVSSIDCQLVILAYTEPRLKLLKLSPVRVDEAVDDNGNSLVPAHFDGRGESANNSAGWPEISATLRFPDKNPGKRITHFHGTVTLVVADKDGKPQQVNVPIDLKDLDMNLKGD